MCVNPKMGFPCGKCHECLARKVNSYVQKYFLEALYRKTMHFVTLTYDNDHLPFKVWDFANGEHNFILPLAYFVLQSVRSNYLASEVSSEHCPIPVSIDGDTYLAVPSLQRHDVVKWIKTFRKNHSIDFSYSFIGEYGKKGRPHYHGVIFGLDDLQIHDLVSAWKNGFVHVDKIPILSSKGQNDIVSVSRYIAKYMHKGTFDDVKVLDRLVEMPRVFSSVGLGAVNFKPMRDWYLAKDLFPKVSIMDKKFSEEYLDIVESRLDVFDIAGKNQHLSKFLKDKLLKYDYTNPLSHKTYKKASNLSLALAHRIQVRLAAQFEKKYTNLLNRSEGMGHCSETDMAAEIARFSDSERISRECKERNSAEIHRKSLSKSKL